MPDSIIKPIEAIAAKEKQEKILVFSNEEPLQDDDAINDDVAAGVDNNNDDTSDNSNPPGILFGELVGNEDEDSEEETIGNESTGVPAESTGVPTESTGVQDSESTGVQDNESTGVQDNENPGVPSDEDKPGALNEIADDATGEQVNANGEEEDEVEPDAADDVANEEEDEVEPNVAPYNPDTWTPSIQRVHYLHPRKARQYSHLHATIMHHAMTQYSLKRV
jgi:hypothetical protein